MEKQIKEMMTVMLATEMKTIDSRCDIPTSREYADDLYNAGYRKQSEGKWVKVMNHKECSKCGYNAPYKKIKAGYHLQDLSNYCPNCGAKMRGAE